MADVLLTHSYHLYFDRKQTRKMRPYPPLGVVRRRLKTGNLVNNNIPKKVALELLAVPNDNSTYFFWTGVGNARTIAGKFSNELQTVFTTAKIPYGHSHRFQDTYALELLKAGADIRTVQKALGHSSLATTEKYYAPWNKAQQDIHNDSAEVEETSPLGDGKPRILQGGQ